MKDSDSSLSILLLDLTRHILDESGASAEKKLELLEQYSDTFDQLLASDEFTRLSSEQLREIETRHERVMTWARNLETEFAHEMVGLRKKGVGLVKYLDVLPKRLSVRNVKKG